MALLTRSGHSQTLGTISDMCLDVGLGNWAADAKECLFDLDCTK